MFGENVTPLLILLAATHVVAAVMIFMGLRALRRAADASENSIAES
jgi:hypothetical protein